MAIDLKSGVALASPTDNSVLIGANAANSVAPGLWKFSDILSYLRSKISASYLDFSEISSPANPATDAIRLFAKDVAGVTKLFTRDSAGTEVQVGAGAGSAGREVLTAARTYYVRLTNGNDSNTGLVDSNGGAFKTAQKAIDTVSALDLSIYNVTISVSEGPCTENLVFKSLVGAGSATLQGDTTTPANVVLSPASGGCLSVNNITGLWSITGFKTISTGGAIQLLVSNAYLNIGVMDYGNAAGSGIHIYCGTGGRINQSAVNKTISATAFGYHFFLDNNAVFYGTGPRATTLTGNPTFITYAYVTNGANLRNGVETFSGSVTSGKKYEVSQNATVESGGNPYPGTIAGTNPTGGQYT